MKQNCPRITQTQELDIHISSLKLTEKEVFERISKSEVADFSKDHFFLFQMHFISNNLEEYFHSFSKKIENTDFLNVSLDNSLIHPLRFLTHVILVLRSLDQDFWPHDTDNIIVAYTKLLARYEKNDIVAVYLSFLPVNLQIEGYSRFLQGD
jgi:nuclear pore complex protein Nup107